MTFIPQISVLMPVRNGAAYLPLAIGSVLTQKFRHLELIVVDDGSFDSSGSIVKAFAARDERVRLMTLPPTGLVGALELGRAAARSEFIARMDADDISLPHRLANQLDFLIENEKVVAVGGQALRIASDGTPLGKLRYPTSSDECRRYLSRGSPLCHPTVLMRRGPLEACGGYRSAFDGAEDYDLWLRLSELGELTNLADVVLEYRVHGTNVTIRNADAGARASALALLIRQHECSLDEMSLAALTGRPWEQIEPHLPAGLRLEARESYLRALILNGGICEHSKTSYLFASLSELTAQKGVEVRQRLAFALVRGAYQLARCGKSLEALKLASFIGLKLPREAFVEIISAAQR